MSRPTHEEWINGVICDAANDLSGIREALEGILAVLARIADKIAPEPIQVLVKENDE